MNKLDQYGFDWYNPPENVEIVSTMDLLNDAIFYRLWQGSIGRSPILSIYKSFDYFILITEALMGNRYLHPNYINSTLNLTDRINRYNLKYDTDINSRALAHLALTIIDWEDLEEITGEDLTEFKDRKLRTNEVFGVGLLTKMYKIVDAFKYLRIQSGRTSHLTGEFLGQIEYTDFYNGDTKWSDNGVSTTSILDSYSFAQRDDIIDSNSDAHNEFVNAFNQSNSNKVTLTTQISSGQSYGSKIERPLNDFRASKQWLYRLSRRFDIASVNSVYTYDYNDNQKDYYGSPITPKFSRGNSTNYYQSPTQVYSYSQEQDITNIEFYEAYCFYQKTDGFDFGTGVVLNDGGVLAYTKNQDNTMETDVFANFSDSTSDFPQLDEPEDGFNKSIGYTLKVASMTYLNFNDTDFNEYKTASPTN